MAQHFELPTRLLDWTANPLVALYSACESNAKNDGAAFAFRPSKSWKSHINVYNDKSDLHRHEPDPPRVEGVRIVYPMMSSERLVAQSGGFTIQNPWTPLESRTDWDFVDDKLEIVEIFKWRVPWKCKESIVSQLLRVGIHHGTLFPDLEGIGTGLFRSELLREHPGSRD